MRRQGGFTMIEVLIVSTLFLVVLTATLASAMNFERLNAHSQQHNTQVEGARRGVDRTMRQLRNLARRIDAPVIYRATATDLIFQTSDPERSWIRHCLQTTEDGRASLWALSARTAINEALAGPCPGTGWLRRDRVTEHVSNYAGGRSVPLFSFVCAQNSPTGCPSTTDDLSRITTVRMDLLVDDLAAKPKEARVTSAVFLRNQNEPPVASFSWKPLGSRLVLLNASASLDPECRTLRFMWFRAPAPAFTCDQPPPAGSILWQGVTLPHTFLSTEGVTGTLRPIELVVCDPGDLQSRTTQQVMIP